MYALLCIFVLVITWMGFLTKIFINLRQDRDMKRHNQKYHKKKVNELKKDINGKAD